MPAKKKLKNDENSNDREQDRGGWISSADRQDIISILDNAPYGIVINSSTGDGDVLYINHETYHLMGYSVSEIPTGMKALKKLSETRDHPQERQKFEAALREAGNAFAVSRVVTKSGALKDLEVRTVLLRSGTVVSMWTDVTRRETAEQALREARDKLEERVNERTSKLKDVNHQLRLEIRRCESIERELERSREELRLLSEHLQKAREEERARISREVHDQLGQFLSALKIDVACLGKSWPLNPDELLNQTGAMGQRIDGAIHAVRHICSELRPSILDDFGLPAAIEWYLDDFQKRTGIRCSAAIDPNFPEEKKGLRLMLFRVFQEAMTNILRHAEATEVDVVLKIASGTLTLKVKDNGSGITKSRMENPRSFGITGIRERVRFWGGSSYFEGAPSQGTTMTVTIPLKKGVKTLL